MNNGTRFTLGVVSLILGILFATIFVNRLQAEEPIVTVPEVDIELSYMDYPFETTHGDAFTLNV